MKNMYKEHNSAFIFSIILFILNLFIETPINSILIGISCFTVLYTFDLLLNESIQRLDFTTHGIKKTILIIVQTGFAFKTASNKPDYHFLLIILLGSAALYFAFKPLISKRRNQTDGLKIAQMFIDQTKELNLFNIGELSDGYHTFNELYYHRMKLFSVICKQNKEIAWRSLKHYDGTMYDDYFIVGLSLPEGNFSYHYELKYWDLFDEIKEIPNSPEWLQSTDIKIEALNI